MIDAAIGLVPLLPLVAAALIGGLQLADPARGEAGERTTAWIAQGAAALALLLLVAIDLAALWRGAAPAQQQLGTWLASGAYRVELSFAPDPLALAFATLCLLIGLLTLRFAVNYLHREPGFHRFFAILSLFIGAMALIALAGNAVLTFVGWELAGVASYLLIAYAHDRPIAAANAGRVFVTNRIGDAGFVVAIFLAFHWLGGIEWPQIVAGDSGLSPLARGLLLGGFVLAALVKSAQVPFAPWIARALEGPTPSSAIFYGALLVHAGVYLLLRLEPLLVQAPVMLAAIALLGLATTAYGALGALVQSDAKSALIFATTTQVGLMFVAIGLGGFDVAALHLLGHAAWRAYQFLHAPALLVLAAEPVRPVPGWLARRRRLHTAAQRRFWLDALADWLIVRPTRSLARDAQSFDEKVVDRLAGLPGQAGNVSSLSEWELRRRGDAVFEPIGRGHGAVGKAMEWLASGLHWFEERLVLSGGGEALTRLLRLLGGYLLEIETLLSRPRYLLLMVMATFVVIL